MVLLLRMRVFHSLTEQGAISLYKRARQGKKYDRSVLSADVFSSSAIGSFFPKGRDLCNLVHSASTGVDESL